MSSTIGTSDVWRTPAPVWVRADPIAWRRETAHLLAVTAYSAIAGGLAGVIWAAVGITAKLTPKSGAVYLPDDDKFMLDNDIRFALVTVLAGVVLALVVIAVGRESWTGPGSAVGLAVGGVLGALVAAHVGHVIGHHSLIAKIYHYAPGADPKRVNAAVAGIDFKVRWWLGLVAWPIGATAVLAVVTSRRAAPA
jgi:hypothetical protein